MSKEESTLWAHIACRQRKLLHGQGAQAVGEQSKEWFCPWRQGSFLFVFLKYKACIFQKAYFLFGFSSEFFFSDARIPNTWGGKKVKREGRGISDGNPDSLSCFCCLRYSASCNLYGPMPAWYLIHTWLLKVQAKGTAVLEYAREGKLSSSAKLLLSLRRALVTPKK